MGLYLGLMSDTSMDAIDAVLVDFDVTPLSIVATNATAFEPALRSRIASLMEFAERVSLDEIGQIDVAAAARRYAPGAALYVCGGGAHNAMLLAALARLASPNRVATTAALGLDPDYVEAVAFTWFSRRTLAGLPSSAGRVTGAEGARILGGVYRHA
jgi:anhydro-N-acetylmuramic acid kinase